MYSTLEVNKPLFEHKSLIHCRKNKTKLKKSIPCVKCQFQDKRLTKKFDSTCSLYQHILYFHSGSDALEYPTKSDCIHELQLISDLMNGGILK